MKRSLLLLIFSCFLLGFSKCFGQTSKPKETITSPSPPGGLEKFQSYIQKNLKYPEEARAKGIEGNVWIEAIVSPVGDLIPESIKVTSSIDESLNAEAIRVVSLSGKWIPAKSVETREPKESKVSIPISFQLNTTRKSKNKILRMESLPNQEAIITFKNEAAIIKISMQDFSSFYKKSRQSQWFEALSEEEKNNLNAQIERLFLQKDEALKKKQSYLAMISRDSYAPDSLVGKLFEQQIILPVLLSSKAIIYRRIDLKNFSEIECKKSKTNSLVNPYTYEFYFPGNRDPFIILNEN